MHTQIDRQSVSSAATSSAATRRQFLELAATGIAAASLGQQAWAARPEGEVPYRTLGRTGEKVSMVGIGGYHLGKPDLDAHESVRIIRTALDEGHQLPGQLLGLQRRRK